MVGENLDSGVDHEKYFSPAPRGAYMERKGPARIAGKAFSKKKLCLSATNKAYLINLLFELSERQDCYYVKYSMNPRDGMYLGRCFMTSDDVVGPLWAELKQHPMFLCSVQDDEFTEKFRT